MASKHISLPQPFSVGDPTEWFQRFDICSKANVWEDATKALKLPTLLEGEALAVWLDLSEDDQKNYGTAKGKILERMSPASFVSLDHFHTRKIHPGESLSVYLYALKKLLEQAMLGLDASTRDKLILHQLLAGLPPLISKQLRASGQVEDLEEVMKRAKLLMTIETHEDKVATVQPEISNVEQLRHQINLLSEQVAALTTQQSTGRSPIMCYRCHQLGHIQRNCPTLQRSCYLCGRKGHLARECR